MVTRLFTARTPPWLHASSMGAYVSFVIVACRHWPEWGWILAPVAVVWSRFMGWLIVRYMFRERSETIGDVELQQVQMALHDMIHNFVNRLAALQGDVDLMLTRSSRLRSVMKRVGGEYAD